jgi:RNA polymerase sigma-70 factor (ECF subfamily)
MMNEEAIVRTYADMVYKIAYRYVANPTDADDVFSETFLTYFKKERIFQEEEHRKAWLIRVTINCAKDLLKDRPHWEELNESLAGDPGPAVSSEEHLDLHKAIQQLRLEYREAICLYYLEGLSVQDIAAVLGRNENTIKTHLARGRERLRHFLEDCV